MRRGQASAEFVVLMAFMLLFFIVITIAIQNQLYSVQVERNEELAADVARVVNNEAVLASKVNPGYRRTFYLPATIDGSDYSLSLHDGIDLVVSFRGEEYLFFLDAFLVNLTPLGPGANVVIDS